MRSVAGGIGLGVVLLAGAAWPVAAPAASPTYTCPKTVMNDVNEMNRSAMKLGARCPVMATMCDSNGKVAVIILQRLGVPDSPVVRWTPEEGTKGLNAKMFCGP